MKIIDEFRQFAVRGNVIDLAVGIIIGSAFGKIVSSLELRRRGLKCIILERVE